MDFLIEIDSVSLQLDDQGLVVVNNPTYHKDPSSLDSLNLVSQEAGVKCYST